MCHDARRQVPQSTKNEEKPLLGPAKKAKSNFMPLNTIYPNSKKITIKLPKKNPKDPDEMSVYEDVQLTWHGRTDFKTDVQLDWVVVRQVLFLSSLIQTQRLAQILFKFPP